jgi:hypothetical protein
VLRASAFNGLRCQTGLSAPIGAKKLFGALSNRADAVTGNTITTGTTGTTGTTITVPERESPGRASHAARGKDFAYAFLAYKKLTNGASLS